MSIQRKLGSCVYVKRSLASLTDGIPPEIITKGRKREKEIQHAGGEAVKAKRRITAES